MAGNFFQNAFEKTKSLANQAVDSTKCAAQKTKIKGKISSHLRIPILTESIQRSEDIITT